MHVLKMVGSLTLFLEGFRWLLVSSIEVLIGEDG